MISVLMATYNGEAFVSEAIESALGQREVELELLITDDGSSDSTPMIARAAARRDPRVRVATQRHGGAAHARNRCLAHARGSYIALLDQDDLWPEMKLTCQLAKLEGDPDLDAVFGLTREFGAADAPEPDAARYTMLLSAGLLRRATLDALGGFDPRCGTADDLDFLLRMLERNHRVELVPELGVLHRRHSGQTSADLARTRQDCVRTLGRSLARRRRQGLAEPLDHPLLAALR